MIKDFQSETSFIAWKLFAETGNIGFYMLYKNIENPPKELMYVEEFERDM